MLKEQAKQLTFYIIILEILLFLTIAGSGYMFIMYSFAIGYSGKEVSDWDLIKEFMIPLLIIAGLLIWTIVLIIKRNRIRRKMGTTPF